MNRYTHNVTRNNTPSKFYSPLDSTKAAENRTRICSSAGRVIWGQKVARSSRGVHVPGTYIASIIYGAEWPKLGKSLRVDSYRFQAIAHSIWRLSSIGPRVWEVHYKILPSTFPPPRSAQLARFFNTSFFLPRNADVGVNYFSIREVRGVLEKRGWISFRMGRLQICWGSNWNSYVNSDGNPHLLVRLIKRKME